MGKHVCTTLLTCLTGGWSSEALKQRREGAWGRVVDLSNAHGLCYQVDYDDGGHGWYDPSELFEEGSKMARLTRFSHKPVI